MSLSQNPCDTGCALVCENLGFLGKNGVTAGTEVGFTERRRSEVGKDGVVSFAVSGRSCEDGKSRSSEMEGKDAFAGRGSKVDRVVNSSIRERDDVSRGRVKIAHTVPKESPATIRNTKNPRSTLLVRASSPTRTRHPCLDHSRNDSVVT